MVSRLLTRRMALARATGEPLLMRLSLSKLWANSQPLRARKLARIGPSVSTRMKRRFQKKTHQTS